MGPGDAARARAADVGEDIAAAIRHVLATWLRRYLVVLIVLGVIITLVVLAPSRIPRGASCPAGASQC